MPLERLEQRRPRFFRDRLTLICHPDMNHPVFTFGANPDVAALGAMRECIRQKVREHLSDA